MRVLNNGISQLLSKFIYQFLHDEFLAIMEVQMNVGTTAVYQYLHDFDEILGDGRGPCLGFKYINLFQ